MNKFIGIGRLVKDPEIRVLNTGTNMANGSVAIQRKFKDENGDYLSDFFNFVAFGATANFIADYFKKGDGIAFEGRLQIRNYTNDSGVKAYVTEIVIENVEFLPVTKPKEEQPAPKKNQFDDFQDQFEITDDDLPF